MIGILGGMGTQAGLDFCNKLAKLNKGKTDQQYPLFVLYNKSDIPGRPENLHKYNKVLKSLLAGCKFLEKNKCKFIVIPCNTAHYWFDDLQKKTKIPIISMPKEVYSHSLGASKWQILRHVIFPNSLPEILTGIRVATGMCWGTLVAAEFLAGTTGVGFVENVAKKYFQYEVIWITIFIMGMLGLLFDITIRKIIDKTIPWRGKG